MACPLPGWVNTEQCWATYAVRKETVGEGLVREETVREGLLENLNRLQAAVREEEEEEEEEEEGEEGEK